ncbi:MAG: hypothetical protein JSW64_03465 [Candidatus Zixiibacteriota bacterium]|nr:MAG: hypothetical protein JSW64_03465 [candidate division Zixibacteria bacterium]
MMLRGIIIILIEALCASMALSQETFSHKLSENKEFADSTYEAIYERQSRLIITETYAIDSSEELKSPFLAFSASLAGLILPIAASPILVQDIDDRFSAATIFALGTCLIVGPASGYFYADMPEYAMKGIRNRAGLGLSGLFICSIAVTLTRDGGGPPGAKFMVAFSTSAVTIAAISAFAIYDVVKVGKRVREKNAKLMKQKRESVSIVPTYFADSGAGGLELNITF